MDNRIGSVWGDGRLPNRGREGVTMGRMKTVAYARGSERGVLPSRDREGVGAVAVNRGPAS